MSVAYIGPKSRIEMHYWHRGSPRHTGLRHHFQDQKVKGQGHQAALLTAALTSQAAAAVSVGTYWAWETTATLRCALRRPQREERGGAYRGGCLPTACLVWHPGLAEIYGQLL